MAHHLGMSLVVLDNYFHDQIMPSRFHANPLVKVAEIFEDRKSHYYQGEKRAGTASAGKNSGRDPAGEEL